MDSYLIWVFYWISPFLLSLLEQQAVVGSLAAASLIFVMRGE